MSGKTSSPRGRSWEEFRNGLLTPEEKAANDLRVELMITLTKAKNETGMSAQKLETISGVKQPLIARMEKGGINAQLSSVLKVLAPLGKTLYVGELQHA